MTTRGPRLKRPELRLVDGRAHHGPKRSASRAKALIKQDRRSFGPLKMPGHLGEAGRQAWQDYIVPATWLTKSREMTAILLCELWEESRDDTKAFTAAKHAQLRAYMAELGLTDERKRDINESEEEDNDEHFGA